MEPFIITIPESDVSDPNMSVEEMRSLVLKAAAVELYRRGDASLGYCAHLAGLAAEDFICLLSEHCISIFGHLNEEELMRDFENA